MNVNSLEVLLHRMMNRIRQSLELSSILSGTVAEVRNFLASDRVMIYQFQADESGEVVAESVQTQFLPSLLGQHFPSEDIPPETRQMYLKARQRTVVDVASQQIGLSPLDCPETGEGLETEDVRFQPIDPCHAEYLTAMGVQSSLVVPILYRQQLWGLLVSHHSSPRRMSERELQIVQLVADQVSIAIAHYNLLESARIQAQQEATINRVAKLLHSMTEMQLQQALEQTVTALQGAGGRVYIAPLKATQVSQLLTCGEQPLGDKAKAIEAYPSWQDWLENSANGGESETEKVWAIADLSQVSLPADLGALFATTKIRGVLILRLHYRQQFLGYLSIFRHAIDIEILWAGQPQDKDPRNLHPRKSFETWRELKHNQAHLWTKSEIELAESLSSHFAMAIHQYELYQQVHSLNADLARDIEERKRAEIEISALNAELEQRVQQRTAELQHINTELIREIGERQVALRERQQTQTSLERLSHQNELILNSAGEGIYGLNLQGKTSFVNPAAARMLGYEVAELHNQLMHNVLKHSLPDGTPYLPEASPIYATLQNGAVHHVTEDIFWRRDGSNFPVEYVSTPIRERGKIVGAVVIFKDITERQVVEQMKDEFISVVSHELRTPLTSIRSTLGLLARGLLNSQPDKSQRLLEIAFDNTNRLVRLINDILDLERIKSGKVTMDKQICNTTDLITQAVEVMQAMAEKARITLAVNIVSVELQVDPDRIIQTLTNLLSNAIKFSPADTTVHLTVKLKDKQMVLFQISDRGRGIPSDKLEMIFDRFGQVDASDSRHQSGTGLGLAICRSIVEQHGGQIWVESNLGEGSIFYFTLPLIPTGV